MATGQEADSGTPVVKADPPKVEAKVEPAAEKPADAAKADAKPEAASEAKPKEQAPKKEQPAAAEAKPKAEPSKSEPKKAEDSKKPEMKPKEEVKQPAADKKPEPKKEAKPVEKKPEPKKEVKPTKVERKKISSVGYSNTPMLRGQPWKVHDVNRPRPRAITPGEPSSYEKAGSAPSDAIVLFDGKDLSNWGQLSREDPNVMYVPEWKVQDGYMEVVGKTGSLRSLDTFGSCQLHVEWAAPEKVLGASQGRGNSGIILMGLYEVQVLDSFNNRTYADGQAGAVYGQYPPKVNATRPPGEWQIYDIVFEAPKFNDGKLVSPAYVTVIHNGVVLHHRQEMYGPAAHKHLAEYTEHQPAGPLVLQDHGNPVRFRNIWVRPLD